jgi:hypothetical protein
MVISAGGVNDIEATAIEAALEESVSLVRKYCGGEVAWSMVDGDHPWAVMA